MRKKNCQRQREVSQQWNIFGNHHQTVKFWKAVHRNISGFPLDTQARTIYHKKTVFVICVSIIGLLPPCFEFS